MKRNYNQFALPSAFPSKTEIIRPQGEIGCIIKNEHINDEDTKQEKISSNNKLSEYMFTNLRYLSCMGLSGPP